MTSHRHPYLALAACLVAIVPTVAVGQTALTYAAPSGWLAAEPSSSMRVAEFTLPRVAPDQDDGSAVIYYFQGAGGSVQENLDRWAAQIRSVGESTTTSFEVDGMPVTVIDISGTYVADVGPGSPDRYDEPEHRLIAAVIETVGGPFFLEIVGPKGTIERWSDSVRAFIDTMRFE